MKSEVDDFLAYHFIGLNPHVPATEESALIYRSLAKARTLAAKWGVSERTLNEELALASPVMRKLIMKELNETPVDPRTGGGLS